MSRSSEIDAELGTSILLEGYPSFASWIAIDRDAAIYRKFECLSARNLLYQQSELHQLERQLRDIDIEDAKSEGDSETCSAARFWKHYSDKRNVKALRHQSLQEQIKVKLKEYHKALIRESQVLALNEPSPRTLRAFRTCYKYRNPVLGGEDAALYDNTSDLVALAPVDADRLNQLLQKHFGWLFKRHDNPTYGLRERYRRVFYYPEKEVQLVGAVISTIFSAILLLGAIGCLGAIPTHNLGLRTGMIALFMCLFAFVVGLLTNARRAEIFGATAAYAAVLVVFANNQSC